MTPLECVRGAGKSTLGNPYTDDQARRAVGPMMPFGKLIKTDDELWKVLTFIRANYRGTPAKKFAYAQK